MNDFDFTNDLPDFAKSKQKEDKDFVQDNINEKKNIASFLDNKTKQPLTSNNFLDTDQTTELFKYWKIYEKVMPLADNWHAFSFRGNLGIMPPVTVRNSNTSRDAMFTVIQRINEDLCKQSFNSVTSDSPAKMVQQCHPMSYNRCCNRKPGN